MRTLRPLVCALPALFAVACTRAGGADAGLPVPVEGACQVEDAGWLPDGGNSVTHLESLGCMRDFQTLASEPLDSTLPGARSVKVVIDTLQNDKAFFQNSVRYQIHYQFASAFLSGKGLPVVPPLSEFNTTEYFRPDRRFILAAITYYEGPKAWVIELSPYDTADASMMTRLFRAVQAVTWFGPALQFHPTSEAVETEAKKLVDIPLVSTEQLYAGIDYQPLSLASAVGRLRFITSAELQTQYVSYQDIVVLDLAPNDISVVQGMVTEEFQTPLSHLNVLARNRKTPNMGLRNAFQNETLRSFEGQLVELTVGATEWKVRAATQAEAEASWQARKPEPVQLPPLDLSEERILEVTDIAVEGPDAGTLRDVVKHAVLAWGGKTAQYAILARTKDVPVRRAFGVPIFYYDQFMRENGFYAQLEALQKEPDFIADPAVREEKLARFRLAMMRAPVNETFQARLKAKLQDGYSSAAKIRFRTSTNSEDLDGFPCAGCYESHTGKQADWADMLNAIKNTFTSTWLFRTYEERTYYGVDHRSVGMALLVHPNFPEEEANGVAVTANPFDVSGLDPAFYVNVQYGGENEVVHPPAGVTSDQILYYFSQPNQPATYLARSNLIPAGKTVLTATQLFQLGTALEAIHQRFSPAYGPASGNTGWYGMDVEFKFDNEDDPSKPATLFVKQARPYPRLTP